MGSRDEACDHFQSGWSREDGITRLELANFELHLIFFRLADIGRVGDDEVETAVLETLEQVGLVELNTRFELMAGGVGTGDLQRRGRDIGGVDFSLGQFLSKSKSDAARACANVGKAEAGMGRARPAVPRQTSKFDYGLDHMLGLGTRNQNRGRHDEIHPPEFLMARDVLCWEASGAFAESRFVAALFIASEFALGMRVEVGAVAAKGEHQQQFRVHARRGNVIRCEAGDGRGKSLFQLHRTISPQRQPFGIPQGRLRHRENKIKVDVP